MYPGRQQESISFQTDLTAEYLIELEVERALPFEQINCLLGVNFDKTEHCSEESVVELQWSVLSTDKIVAKGISAKEHYGAWGSKISRTIGRFQGEKGHKYVVRVLSYKDGSKLIPTNPNIAVQTHPMESKEYYVYASLMFLIATIISGIGLIWLLASFMKFRSKGSASDGIE